MQTHHGMRGSTKELEQGQEQQRCLLVTPSCQSHTICIRCTLIPLPYLACTVYTPIDPSQLSPDLYRMHRVCIECPLRLSRLP